MHTSEANLASKRLMYHNHVLAQAQMKPGEHLKQQRRGDDTDGEPLNFQVPNTQHHLEPPSNVGLQTRNGGVHDAEHVFKSLEIENMFSGGREETMAQLHKMK